VARRKIKYHYDEEHDVTVVRLGQKGCKFAGKPNAVHLRDAEYILRNSPIKRKKSRER